MQNQQASRSPSRTYSLVLWDVLLGFAMWQVVFALNAVIGRMELSVLGFAGEAEIIDLAPSVAVWIGIRAALGLYSLLPAALWPFKHRSQLDREAIALSTTVAVLVSAALEDFSSASGAYLQSPLVLLWALGLLVAAPVVRPAK